MRKEQRALLDFLSDYLNHQISKNDSEVHRTDAFSSFEGSKVNFTAAYYVKRIVSFSGASPCCLIAALLYLDRFQSCRPGLRLTSCNLQRLLLVAAMTAAKYLEDVTCLNSRWAKIGGLTLKELNDLELEFLFAVEFNLSVTPDDYSTCVEALREFRQRNIELASSPLCCARTTDDGERRSASSETDSAVQRAELGLVDLATREVAPTILPGHLPVHVLAVKVRVASPAPNGPASPASEQRENR